MVHSEGARRLIALFAVVAGIGAQSVVTSPVEANENSELHSYGVLLGSKLAAPVRSAQQRTLVLPPQAAEPPSSAAAIFRMSGPLEFPTDTTLAEQRRLAVPSELMKIERDWPEHRDASGTPIELTENDVLIPARMPY